MAEKARDITRRIKSIASTKKITNAMELIAASRIVKAQIRLEKSRPYSRAISEMIEMLASEASSSPLLAEREVHNVAIVVITGDRGLAGAYNSNVLREAQRAAGHERELGHNVITTTVGRKGASYLSFRKVPLAASFRGMSDAPSYADAKQVAEGVIAAFTAGEIDKVVIAYTEFVSAFLQRSRVAQILPVPRPEDRDKAPGGPTAVFDFEPEPAELLQALLPRYVEVRMYSCMLESSASEHAARRRAMKNATDNAEELIDHYRLRANKARQAEITNEIADIVGATEALRGA